MPNALELLAICVSVGLSLDAAFQRVAAEIKLSSPALADEFSLTWAEISISPSREQALANMAERVNLPAVKSVIGTLIQSLRFGTPLAQSLRNAASEMRNHQMIELGGTGEPAAGHDDGPGDALHHAHHVPDRGRPRRNQTVGYVPLKAA